MADDKHLNDMSAEELRDLVWDLSSAALDLAQHLAFTNDMLQPEYQEVAYKRAEVMAYDIAWRRPQPTDGVAMLGETGLTHPLLEERASLYPKGQAKTRPNLAELMPDGRPAYSGPVEASVNALPNTEES